MSMGYDDDDPRGEVVRKRLRTGYYGNHKVGSDAHAKWAFRAGALGVTRNRP
jgi:hypothetical protein